MATILAEFYPVKLSKLFSYRMSLRQVLGATTISLLAARLLLAAMSRDSFFFRSWYRSEFLSLAVLAFYDPLNFTCCFWKYLLTSVPLLPSLLLPAILRS